MIRSLRCLPWTRTLLYLHVKKAQEEEDRLWEHAGPLAEPCLGCKQLQGLWHVGIRGCVGKTAVGRSHLAGTPHPTAPFALSLNHALIPPYPKTWTSLGATAISHLGTTPGPPPRYVVCPVTLDHKEIWVCSSQHKNSPTATDQKSLRKARVRFLAHDIGTSMLGHSSEHALCFLPLMALRFLKPRMSTLYLKLPVDFSSKKSSPHHQEGSPRSV